MLSALKRIFFLFLLSFFAITLAAQSTVAVVTKESGNCFIEMSLGLQMSGIKDEDFITSNYSPLLKIVAGYWLSTGLGFQFGYKGLYFNTISDSIKHYYTYVYGELFFDVKSLIKRNNETRIWSVLIHAGPGYFYNEHYNKPNICGNLGIQNQFCIILRLLLSIDIAAIAGWDIYQGDKDILPGISGGLVFRF